MAVTLISPGYSSMVRDLTPYFIPDYTLVQACLFPNTVWSTGVADSPIKKPTWAPAEKCHGFY